MATAYTVYYAPEHTQPYYVKVVVTADGAQVDPAGKVVLVSESDVERVYIRR